MGTRADFYVGRGENAEWLGSIAWDGYRIAEMAQADADKSPDNTACWSMKSATDEGSFRKAVADLLSVNDDATRPEQGWPWPWNDSGTTDYAYAFDGGKTWASEFGHAWFDINQPRDEDADETGPSAIFPDMSARQNVTFGDRSGVIVVTA